MAKCPFPMFQGDVGTMALTNMWLEFSGKYEKFWVNPYSTTYLDGNDHSPISCIDQCVKALVTQSCLTLCDLMDCSPLGSSVPGILQARILEWVAITFCRGSFWPRDWTQVSCTAGGFFTVWATRKAHWPTLTESTNSKAVYVLQIDAISLKPSSIFTITRFPCFVLCGFFFFLANVNEKQLLGMSVK